MSMAIVGSPKRLARIAGLLYLVVGILGGFAFAAVYSTMYVAGDAGTTASNLVANSGLVRMIYRERAEGWLSIAALEPS